MILSKNIHEKLVESIQIMIIETKVNLPYYANFLLFVSFHEDKNMPTCGVNMTSKGMNYYYNSDFLNSLSQKEVNFVNIHECFHLLWDHQKRTISGQYNHKLSNIAQDMIINHIIVEEMPNFFVEIPKDKEGKNMALFLPKEYNGQLIFEELYEWLRDKKDKREKEKNKNKSNCKSCGGSGEKQEKQDGEKDKGSKGKGTEPCPDCDDEGEGEGGEGSKYGPYGKNPRDKNGTIDTWSLDDILDNIDNNDGQYLDVHLTDEIPEELRNAIIKDTIERLKSRGLEVGDIEKTLNKLRKKRKDYLKYIKRSVSNLIFGTKKNKTITKPNRRQIQGLKGHKKIKTKIVCILDVSGSMWGLSEKVLNYIYRNDIEVILIQADTQVQGVTRIKSMKELTKNKIIGGGGTQMAPAINYANENYSGINILLLTDGYHENLDLSKVRGNILIVSAGVKSPIANSNGKVKQLIVDQSYS